jgi:glycosyltransferase involved in cell wall biosynthesis
MEHSITVSVVIPLYNAAEVIAETLRSVLAQSWTDREILVIDDGSTDGSADVVKSFGDRVRYYAFENGGVAKARNRGIALARGRYIALMDHDDLWDKTKLGKQVRILDERPEVGMVITEIGHLDRAGKPTGEVAKAYNGADPFYGLFVKGYAPTPSAAMIRKSILEAVGGFDESFSSAGMDDHELWPRIAAVTEIASISEVLTFHRNRSNMPAAIGLGHRLILIQKLQRGFGHDPQKNHYLLCEEARYLADMGKHLVKEGRYTEGRSCLVQGLRKSLMDAKSPKIAWRCFLRLIKSYS